MSIIDGRLLTEPVETSLLAGHQAMVPTIIDATDRDLPIGTAASKEQLFALFGPDTSAARKVYDPLGDQTLDELKQQVFANRTMTEPMRHFANEMARAGQPAGCTDSPMCQKPSAAPTWARCMASKSHSPAMSRQVLWDAPK